MTGTVSGSPLRALAESGKRRNLLTLADLGKADYDTLNALTTQGFTGHEMVDDAGVIHMGGRIYDPKLARFMSADPIVSDLTNVQRLNRYSYVLNSPLSMVDPSGYEPNYATPSRDIGFELSFWRPLPPSLRSLEDTEGHAGFIFAPEDPEPFVAGDDGTNGGSGQPNDPGTPAVVPTSTITPTAAPTHRILGDVDTGVSAEQWQRLMLEAEAEVAALFARIALEDAARAQRESASVVNTDVAVNTAAADGAQALTGGFASFDKVAFTVLPGYALGTCLRGSACSGADWTWGVIGIIPAGGKLFGLAGQGATRLWGLLGGGVANTGLFRGGHNLAARLGVDVRAGADGLIHPIGKNGKPQGLSLNVDPKDPFIQKYGGAFTVTTVPKGLQVLQSGKAGHFVVSPA